MRNATQVVPLRRSEAKYLRLGLVEQSENRDDQPAIRSTADLLDGDGQITVLGRLHFGEVVEQRDVVAGRVDVGAGVGDQARLESRVPQVFGDARGGRDGPFETSGRPFAAVGASTRVEHDRRARLPRLFLAPDHQLARTRCRPPVHAAQVVAVTVFAGGRVILAVYGDGAGVALAGTGVLAREAHHRQRMHLRDHDQMVDTRERPRQLAQAERVGQPYDQRADLEPAAYVGANRVRHRTGVPAAETLEHDSRTAAERIRQPVFEQQRAGGEVGQVLEPEENAGRHADLHPVRVERPVAGQPVAAAADVPSSEQRQRGEQDRHAQEVLLAENQRGECRRTGAVKKTAPATGKPP